LIRRALNLSKEAKGFIIVGTSGSVAPACKLPKIAKQAGGARIIEISPRETDLSDSADLLLLGSAATVLPDLLEAVRRRLEEKHAEKVARSVPEENGDATEKQPLSSDNALKLDEID
jgi:thiamine pyrophosphate-dependent acetolactate synthase large subunit-like protein